jgi:glutathione S-transferase
MLKIWGRVNSSNVQKVLWAADEAGAKYERIDAGGAFGVVREPKYLAMNPNGLVPTVEDGDLVLWESNTIVRYIAARYGKGSLWIENPGKRAAAEKWMDWGFTLGASNGPLFLGYVRTPPEKRDAAALEASRLKAIEAWGIVERQVASQPWLAGRDFTIADIALGVFVHRWHQFPIDRGNLPNLAAYYERLKARPIYSRHVVSIQLT